MFIMLFFFIILYFSNVLFSNKNDLSRQIHSLECERIDEINAVNAWIDIIRRNQHMDNLNTKNSIDLKRSNIQALNNKIYILKRSITDVK